MEGISFKADRGYVLEMNAIDKRFLGVRALKKCSLNLLSGEVLALVGENGAGKSTMMKILTGIYEADEGEIFCFGSKVKLKTPRDAQVAGISIVHQELNLMNQLTVAQTIFIGRESKGFFLDDKIINKKTEGLFNRLGVNISPLTLTSQRSQYSPHRGTCSAKHFCKRHKS